MRKKIFILLFIIIAVIVMWCATIMLFSGLQAYFISKSINEGVEKVEQ